jgi:hypothetical protein
MKPGLSARTVYNDELDTAANMGWLLSDEGKDAITQLHVDGILSYVRACE